MFQVGEKITVRALKPDGICYRWWETTVEEVTADWLITLSPPGQQVYDIRHPEGGWVRKNNLRAYYWYDKLYNLIEVYRSDGELFEIYVNIDSPPTFAPGIMEITDHQLDIIYLPPDPPRIVDEDEFAAAVAKYGYSPEFQTQCRAAASDALLLAANWQPRGL